MDLNLNPTDFEDYASDTDLLLGTYSSSNSVSNSFRVFRKEIERNFTEEESYIPISSKSPWKRNLVVRLGSCLFIGLLHTFLWQLIPLDIGVSKDDKKDGVANYWLVTLGYLGVYQGFVAIMCFYCYPYFMDAWNPKTTPIAMIFMIIFTNSMTVGSTYFGVDFLEHHMSKIMVTFTVLAGIAYSTIMALRKHPHEKPKWFLNGLCLLAGTVIASFWWNVCQYFSNIFIDSEGTYIRTVILTLYGVAYVVMSRLLQTVLKMSTHKQSDMFFWQNYLFAMLYYVYYRNLFTAIEGWPQFFLLHGLHMVSELFLIIPFSHLFISLFNNIAPIPCMQIQHEEYYYKRACQMYCIREITKIYTVVAMIIFVYQIRHYSNSSYYPFFNDISESDYQHFLEYLTAMLAAEILTTTFCMMLIMYYLKVSLVKIGLDILFKNSFWVGLMLVCIHTTNDPYFTLLQTKNVHLFSTLE